APAVVPAGTHAVASAAAVPPAVVRDAYTPIFHPAPMVPQPVVESPAAATPRSSRSPMPEPPVAGGLAATIEAAVEPPPIRAEREIFQRSEIELATGDAAAFETLSFESEVQSQAFEPASESGDEAIESGEEPVAEPQFEAGVEMELEPETEIGFEPRQSDAPSVPPPSPPTFAQPTS